MSFLFLPLLWIAVTAGRQANRLVLGGVPKSIAPVEQTLFGLATGLGLFAYSILGLGLLGLLSPVPIVAVILLWALAGVLQYKELVAESLLGLRQLRASNLLTVAATLLAVSFLFVALLGCWAPPTGAEYDSLSYHLADPKIYLRYHRIIYLPWESHSNFAFTMEMLYTIGLVAHSVALAKLFHWTMAVIAVLTTYRIGRHVAGMAVGLGSALLLCSIPLVFWEAGTAYVDLGATALGLLGLLALTQALSCLDLDDRRESSQWLLMCGIMMGWMISVKATSLIPSVLYLVVLWIAVYRQNKDVMSVLRVSSCFCTPAALIGCAWYVKSWITTGNPVYPFAYSLFKGRYWSSANAATYTASQNAFGIGHGLADLLLSPWNLIMYLFPGHLTLSGNSHPYNDFPAAIVALTPLFLCIVFIPSFVSARVPRLVKLLSLYAVISAVIWFFLTQQVRYLLPIVPVLCLISSYWIVRLFRERAVAGFALMGMAALSCAFSVWVAISLLSNLAPLLTGGESYAAYISRGFPAYAAMQFLNTQTPATAGVVFYGEPRGFYCNRNYIWGEPGHGLYIPYRAMHSAGDLRSWLIAHGIDYIYIASDEAHFAPGDNMNGYVYELTSGSSRPPVFAQPGTDIAIYALLPQQPV